jgi:hypothetical protein
MIYVTYSLSAVERREKMMPVIRINDAAFADLKSIATWLGTATPGETIDQLVRQAMDQLGMERDVAPEPDDPVTTKNIAMEFPDGAPGLSFTKPLSAFVNHKSVRSPRWSSILLSVIAQVKAKGFEGEKLVKELNVPAQDTQYDDEGFKYHPDLGISVQGQSASDAWREIDRLARKWQIPVKVEFWWRHNRKAQYPGRVGILRSGGA